MANYNNLKAGIDAVIKTNGRQEISGAALNTQLKNMITELGAGYQYMGVATPATNPGTPDANVFYLASEAGTYTNFRGIVINEGEVCALVWNGSWTKQVTGAATAEQVNQLGQKVGDYDLDRNEVVAEGITGRYLTYGVFEQVDNYVTIKPILLKSKYKIELYAYCWGTVTSMIFLSSESGAFVSNLVASTGEKQLFTYINEQDTDVYVGVCYDSRKSHSIYTQKAYGLAETKEDKIAGKSLIDSDFASSQSAIDNPEYLQVVLDGDRKLIEGFTTDGKKEINAPIITPSAEIDYADNPEYMLVTEDEDGKIVSGRTKDGVLVEKVGVKSPNGDFDYINISEKGLTELKEALDLEEGGNILMLHPKEVVLPILKTFKDRPSWFLPYSENYKYVNFNMLWFSDLHHVERRLARINEFFTEYAEQIDCVLCSGDAVNSFGESFDFWHDIGADSFLNVIGNHECFGGERIVGNKELPGWIPPGYSQKECYDKYFKDYISETGITIQENKAYWYKDYVLPAKTNTGEIVEGVFAYKIRLIGIDYYHWKESRTYSDGTPMEQWPDGQPLDNGVQQIWLRNLLADSLSNDYSVICVMHNPVTNSNFQKGNTPFQALEPYLIDPDFSHTDILDEVQTFINNGGKFITWLTGHTHDDRFGTIKSHPDQMMITVGTAGNLIQAPGSQWEFPSFMDRTENTMNDDLFDIVSINTFAHTITLLRIGSPYDKHGRKMDSIAYDYINKNIL